MRSGRWLGGVRGYVWYPLTAPRSFFALIQAWGSRQSSVGSVGRQHEKLLRGSPATLMLYQIATLHDKVGNIMCLVVIGYLVIQTFCKARRNAIHKHIKEEGDERVRRTSSL